MEPMLYAKGISWIDDCRIPFSDGGWGQRNNRNNGLKANEYGHKKMNQQQNTQGRFPANILVCDDMLNDGVISKSDGGKGKIEEASFKYDKWNKYYSIGDKGTNSRYYDIDKWFNNLLEL